MMYNAPMEAPLQHESEPNLTTWKKTPYTFPLILGLAAIFLFRVMFCQWVNLIPDECSYWAWSRRIDWSYFDNSGMVAYLIRLSTELLQGHTPFIVRLPFLILSFLSTYLIYRIYVILFVSVHRGRHKHLESRWGRFGGGDGLPIQSNRAQNRFKPGGLLLLFKKRLPALLCAFLFNLTPVALLGGALAMHDNALIFCWVAATWAAARFIKDKENIWLYIIGLFAGLAILSKYTGVLLLPSLLLFFLISKDFRPYLLKKETWISVGMALAFTIPIIIWNIKHDWASLYHILFIGTGSDSITRKLSDGLGYHLAQFLVLSPLFYWAMIFSSITRLIKRSAPLGNEELLLYCLSFPVALFGIIAFKGHVEANWAIMAYPPLAILAVNLICGKRYYYRDAFFTNFNMRYLKLGMAVSVIPVLLIVIHGWVGLAPAWLERKLGKADRIIWETRGWRELGIHVANLRQEREVIAGDKYQMCAILEFNVPGLPKARYLAPWRRPTQFDVWEPSFDNLAQRDILFVTSRRLKPSDKVRTTIYENFKEVKELPPYKVMYHNEPIREIYVYRGYSFDPFKPRRLGPRSLFYSE